MYVFRTPDGTQMPKTDHHNFTTVNQSVLVLFHVCEKSLARATDSNDVTQIIFHLQMLLLIPFPCVCARTRVFYCRSAGICSHVNAPLSILRYCFFFWNWSVNGKLFIFFYRQKWSRWRFAKPLFSKDLEFEFSHRYCTSSFLTPHWGKKERCELIGRINEVNIHQPSTYHFRMFILMKNNLFSHDIGFNVDV